MACYQEAIRLQPGFLVAHLNWGTVCKTIGQWPRAVALLQAALRLHPHPPGAWNNLGNAFLEGGQLERAMESYRQAITLSPGLSQAHFHPGLALARQGGSADAEAIHCLRRAVSLQPDLAEARWNLALLLLRHGALTEGWQEFEWRWHRANFGADRRRYTEPEWNGQPLRGQTILLHPEQGAGDLIQFIRYAPLVAARGGRVLVGAPKSMKPLLSTVPGVSEVISSEAALPPFDWQAPLMSLPRIFGTTLETVPGKVPYLFVPPGSGRGVVLCRNNDHNNNPSPNRNPNSHPNPDRKVGLVWAGAAAHRKDHLRSIPLPLFLPLLRGSGCTFYSLQVGERAGDVASLPTDVRIKDLSGCLVDYAATAAVLAQLDLVITVDTSVAHLAGAMGRPVWNLLQRDSDWRWLWERNESPWYPTMRLFRQGADQRWEGVVEEVGKEMRGDG